MEVPTLRIVAQELWDAVKARQMAIGFAVGRDDDGNAFNRAHRREFLLSGLLTCGCRGGGYTIMAKDRYGCATRRAKGTCDNTYTISRHHGGTAARPACRQRGSAVAGPRPPPMETSERQATVDG